MFSYIYQDQVSMNSFYACQQKEAASSFENEHMDSSLWSSHPSTEPTAEIPLFQPTAYMDSPVMATPFLDNGCSSPTPTATSTSNHPLCCNIPHTTNTPVEHYLGVVDDNRYQCGPTFTGNPMELLICKSNRAGASPAYSSPSDGIPTPLFDPIEYSPNNDEGASNQQYEFHQQELDAFLQENNPFEMNTDSMDWSCFHGGDISLFQELEDVTNISSSNSVNTPFLLKTTPRQVSPLPSSPTTNQQHLITRRSTDASTTTSTSTKKSATTSRSTATKNNKRQGNISLGQATRKRANQKDDDNDDEEDNKGNKKRSATKKRTTDQDEKRYGCPICRRKFSRRYNLNTHIRTHNANRIKEHVCDICHYGFDRKHDRDRHVVSVHHVDREFKCDTCDAAFCRRDALMRHTLKSHPQ